MIKRIIDAEEFKELTLDIDEIASDEEVYAHAFLKHDTQTIINCYANTHLLTWDFFVWGHHNGERWDSVIAFVNDKNPKFNECLFSEVLWFSSNPKVGYKLLAEALDFAKEKDFKYVVMSAAVKHPQFQKVTDFYKKLGFVKDSETYVGKL
tara:strand:+ start:255 stop:707 length:453 start_codon:yes stop_codon:yes gene_type:complete